jgi:hypothetical protein
VIEEEAVTCNNRRDTASNTARKEEETFRTQFVPFIFSFVLLAHQKGAKLQSSLPVPARERERALARGEKPFGFGRTRWARSLAAIMNKQADSILFTFWPIRWRRVESP